MAYCNKRLILASGSPRRRELLDKFGINYEILPAQGEESAPPELTPGERVKALAAQKAEEVAQRLNDPAAVILNVGDSVTVRYAEGEGSILTAVSVKRTAPAQTVPDDLPQPDEPAGTPAA